MNAYSSMGRQVGYRDPNAKRDRISFRLPDSLSCVLERHRFEEEDTQSFINRMVRISTPLSEDHARLDFVGEKVNYYSFRAEPVVLGYLNSLPISSPQMKMEYILSRAATLPVVESIKTTIEALDFVKSFNLPDRVEVKTVLDLLTQRCADSVARRLLKSLDDEGLISLIQSSDRSGSVKRINICGTQYGFVSV